jgi:hypothetical protein
MIADLGRARPAPETDVMTRAAAVPALAALAVIHVVDLPGTLGPDRLVGIGYLGIIAAAILTGGAMIARSHWLAWSGAGGLAVAAMTGYLLTRALPGGFLGDHADVGNWRCPLGIAALAGRGFQDFFVAAPGIAPIAISPASAGNVSAGPSGGGYGGY